MLSEPMNFLPVINSQTIQPNDQRTEEGLMAFDGIITSRKQTNA
jgi:hypothetical protein